ncbi:hypothetical protein J3B02_005214 [Coemansia erecta]|nr:hypothetical protein J3B02_005214 [Coemansia erecta]
MHPALEKPAGTIFSAAAGSVVSEGSAIELIGQVQRVDLLDFLKEQARVREQREAARAEERRHAKRLRDEEEMRFHEFQMSLITLIQKSIVQPESCRDSPMVTESVDKFGADDNSNDDEEESLKTDTVSHSESSETASKHLQSEDDEVSEEIEIGSKISTPAETGGVAGNQENVN